MSFGLDYISGPPIADLQKAGVAFVCRYLSEVNAETRVKLLTKAEADALIAGGIAIVSNYEWYDTRPLDGQTADAWYANGAHDAQTAAEQHAACGGPGDRPIYFSVDFDMTPNEAAAVAAYFKGVASVIGLPRTGAYGSANALKSLFDAGLITWGWQTYAWSNGVWEPRAHIQQYSNGVVMSGKSVDYNRSTADDYGQWGGKPMSSIPDGWSDDGATLKSPNGVPVVMGFRAFILAHGWDKDNYALGAEQGMSQLEASNKALGGGTQQLFRWAMLGYTPTAGVFVEWVGVELDYQRKQYAALYQAYQKLQAQPTQAATVDPRISQYAAKLQAVHLLAQQIVTQAVP